MMEALPETKTLDLELTDGWLNVWFNSPEENRNALTDERAAELRELCRALEDRRDIRGVVFRGRDFMFCAGGDLKSFKQAVSGEATPEATMAMSRAAGELYNAVNSLPQFTIMAVEGACIAGGLGLACCGDIVLANIRATFALAEVKIGLVPAQIAPFVMQRVGFQTMRRMALTGVQLNGNNAAEVGLANAVIDGNYPMEQAIEFYTKEVSESAPGALAATKRFLLELNSRDIGMQIENAAQTFTDCMFSEEGREGLTAFAEKRKPDWQSLHRKAS